MMTKQCQVIQLSLKTNTHCKSSLVLDLGIVTQKVVKIPNITNIPLDEIIDICIDSLYKDEENSPKIPKDIFLNFLRVATKESFFIFNNKFYKQIDGVAMWSPLGPALANIFMCSFKNK